MRSHVRRRRWGVSRDAARPLICISARRQTACTIPLDFRMVSLSEANEGSSKRRRLAGCMCWRPSLPRFAARTTLTDAKYGLIVWWAAFFSCSWGVCALVSRRKMAVVSVILFLFPCGEECMCLCLQCTLTIRVAIHLLAHSRNNKGREELSTTKSSPQDNALTVTHLFCFVLFSSFAASSATHAPNSC